MQQQALPHERLRCLYVFLPSEETNGRCLVLYLSVCKMGILCSEKLPEKPKEVCNIRESSAKEIREEHSFSSRNAGLALGRIWVKDELNWEDSAPWATSHKLQKAILDHHRGTDPRVQKIFQSRKKIEAQKHIQDLLFSDSFLTLKQLRVLSFPKGTYIALAPASQRSYGSMYTCSWNCEKGC